MFTFAGGLFPSMNRSLVSYWLRWTQTCPSPVPAPQGAETASEMLKESVALWNLKGEWKSGIFFYLNSAWIDFLTQCGGRAVSTKMRTVQSLLIVATVPRRSEVGGIPLLLNVSNRNNKELIHQYVSWLLVFCGGNNYKYAHVGTTEDVSHNGVMKLWFSFCPLL